MKRKINSTALVRVLLSITLIALLTLGVIAPARADTPLAVTGWGDNYYGTLDFSDGMTDIIAIAAGANHSLALKSDGTVLGWGYNGNNQVSIPAGLSDVVAISAGNFHSLALKSDGTVVGWGENSVGQTNIPAGLNNAVAIDAGGGHNLALKSDGTVVGWGHNIFWQATPPVGLSGVVAIATGNYYSMVLKDDGTLVCWGWDYDGVVSGCNSLTGVVAIAAGGWHALALKEDGTVSAWGSNGYCQTNVPAGLSDVAAIDAGEYNSLALKSDGTVVGWGWDDFNQTHGGSNLTGITTVAAGMRHTLALIPAEDTANYPTANPGGPYLGAIDTSISFDGSLSTDPNGDPLTYAWDFGDTGTAMGATPTHSYSVTGIYDVCLTVNDGLANSDPACTVAVIYDPSAGFVTGGGWIISPEGAYKPDESLSGKATFGFVAKYKKGSDVPTGNTAFDFNLAGLSFSSESYDWLLVNQNGTNTQFKGSGLINGALDPNGNAYKFMLWASDGSLDTFRIRIWWEDTPGNELAVYDNGVHQEIGAGNIVVHTDK